MSKSFSVTLAVIKIFGVPFGGLECHSHLLAKPKLRHFRRYVVADIQVVSCPRRETAGLVRTPILGPRRCGLGEVVHAVLLRTTLPSSPISSFRATKVILAITPVWFVSFLFSEFFQVWRIRWNWVTCKLFLVFEDITIVS